MNQKILTLVLAFFVMGIAACKKDEKALTCQLIARSNGVDSATITYDAQGRVSSYGTASSTYTFTYSGLTAQCVVSTPANPNAGSYNVYLNGDGTVSSMSESITLAVTHFIITTVLSIIQKGVCDSVSKV